GSGRRRGAAPPARRVKEIAPSRGNETLAFYRLSTEPLGAPPPGDESRRAPRAREPAPTGPAPAPGGTSWLFGQAMAWAADEDVDEGAIRALLNRYGAALESRNVDQIAALQEQMTDAQRQKLQTYFEIAPDLKVQISGVDV